MLCPVMRNSIGNTLGIDNVAKTSCKQIVCSVLVRYHHQISLLLFKRQNYPPEVFCKKRCSLNIFKIHRKTPVPESVFK